MNSEQLLSKQGPLAHVWLAANYEKKLSKQQFLSTNIVTSSKYISQPSQTAGTITLRLSGQLLLGIVRIYSRKTKYLLDDVNDVLYKLKNSFKFASGGIVIGSNESNVVSAINLPALKTILSNVSNILLTDQVTDIDLLYQNDLNLDDIERREIPNTLFSQVNSSVNEDTSYAFDQSVEFGRYDEPADEDVDLELDFDLDNDADQDNSIEVGRNAEAVEQNQSMIDMETFDFGHPLETIEPASNEPATPPPPRRIRKALVGITDNGELKTNKRKLQVDSVNDLESGIPTTMLRAIQQAQLNGNSDSITLELSEREKLQLIYELSAPFPSKKRKLWDLDERLQQECSRLAEEEEQDEIDFTNDFNLSLPDLESDHGSPQPEIPEQLTQEEELFQEHSTETSIQIASHLRDAFNEHSVTDLADVIQRDLNVGGVKNPLGAVHRGEETVVNQKRQATKCFFELLVLGTQDCVLLKQESSGTDIGGRIEISSRDKLYSSFL